MRKALLPIFLISCLAAGDLPPFTLHDPANFNPENVRIYLDKANNGDIEAEFLFGFWLLYYSPISINNARNGFKWIKKAADAGDARAERVMGVFFLKKHDYNYLFPDDYSKMSQSQLTPLALKYFESAATHGDSDAIYELGILQKNNNKSLEYIKQAADGGSESAMIEYASRSKNIDTMAEYTCKAASKGSNRGMYLLGGNLCYQKRYDEAIAFAEKCADRGFGFALESVGQELINLKNNKKYNEIGKNLLIRSGYMESPGGLYYLGECFEDGIGVSKDGVKAYAYYQKASDLGNLPAKQKLSDQKRLMNFLSQDYSFEDAKFELKGKCNLSEKDLNNPEIIALIKIYASAEEKYRKLNIPRDDLDRLNYESELVNTIKALH